MKDLVKKHFNIIILGLISIPIGAVIGGIDALFGRVLLLITDFRNDNPFYLIPFLAIGGMAVVFAYNKLGKGSEKGMSLVFDVANGRENKIPIQLVPLIMIGTWITHLFGGSAGREGVAVQIGATVSHSIGRRIKIADAGEILLISGMAAGFSGLFRTPFAAVLFALEVIVAGELRYKAILPSVLSSLTACWVSSLCGLEKFSVDVNVAPSYDFKTLIKLIILGVIFGVVGGGFAWCLKKAKAFTSIAIENNIVRIGVISVGLSVALLLLFKGRYAGLGTNLISASFSVDKIYTFDFILKFLLTIITLSAGFQGGEVTPLFSIGASLGTVLAGLMGMPMQLVAALGYSAVFGCATNTFFAPVLICAEVFGLNTIPYAIVVCAVGYVFNANQSIYTSQKNNGH